MIYKIFTKISLTALIMFASFTASAQSILQGVVKSEGNISIKNAYVSIPALGVGVTTNEKGEYSIGNLPAGNYVVEVSSKGYGTETSSATVDQTGSRELNFVLDKMVKTINEVVITGVSNPKTALESSISISSLRTKDISNGVARTTAEIFRTIPGIRSESSGGDGNSNITVRGIPVSAGGSRYMLIQEDGLPVLQFGDVSFGTQDQFLRYDNTVSKIEALRGGSASILASNSPAGIINFISKTGETEGGSIGTTVGLNYNQYRTDFDYGLPLGNNLFLHLGGFYRIGDGPRKTGFTSNNGGQFKMNLTKRFDKGYTRVYLKLLEDRTAAYMPMPIQVSGTNASPKWAALTGFDPYQGALQSPYLMFDRTLGRGNNILESDVSDGMHSKSMSLGNEIGYNFDNGWRILNKARFSLNSGQFLAPFPANVGSASAIFGGITGFGSATYAGTTTAVSPTSNAMIIHLFNTTLDNFNNFVNDLSVSKQFDKIRLNAGIYKSFQNIGMTWNWNSYVSEIAGSNARLIDVKDTAGKALTSNGLLAYGVPGWGNCCNRMFNTHYETTAPYVEAEYRATEALTVDGGVRYNAGRVSGSFAGGQGQTASIDMNGNGVIDANEKTVATQSGTPVPVSYKFNYMAYSIGANYKLSNWQSLFIRTSKGGATSADRILFNGAINYTNNSDPVLDAQKVNTVAQTELGYKYRRNRSTINATAFMATTNEFNYEATTQKKTANKYQSYGIELDGSTFITNDFSIRGGFTYTAAKIQAAIDTSIIGKTPRRMPAIMLNINPNYNFGNGAHSVGFTLLGVSKSFAQDNNKLVMPGYLVINPYVNFTIIKNLTLNFSANNVLNALGITEAEEGAIVENTNNIVRGRPIPGRSFSTSLRLLF